MNDSGTVNTASETPPTAKWTDRLAAGLRRFRGPILGVAAVGTVLGGLAGYWNGYRAVRQAVLPAPEVSAAATSPSPVVAPAANEVTSPTARRMRFAVLPFDAPADDATAQALARTAFEATEASQADRFLCCSVASRAAVERSLVSHASPSALGEALGVRFLIRGRVARVADGHTLHLTLIEAASERVLNTRAMRIDTRTAATFKSSTVDKATGLFTQDAMRVEVAAARSKPDEQLDARDLAFRAQVDWQQSSTGIRPVEAYIRASKSLDRALDLAPDDLLALQMRVHINLFCDCAGAQVPSAPERERLALDALDRYLLQRPDSTHMLMLRSFVFHKNNRQAEALYVTDEVLRLDPEHADALAMRTGILFEMKRYDEARAALPAMLHAREDAQRHALAAATHFALRDDDAAVLHARKAISQMDGMQAVDPQFGSVRLTLAAAEARAGRLDSARTALADFGAAVPQVQTVTQVKSWLTDTSPVVRDATLYDGLLLAGMPR